MVLAYHVVFGTYGFWLPNDPRGSYSRGNVTVLACAILPDHVHLVIGRHSSKIEWIYNCFKGSATRELRAQKLHPLEEFVLTDGTVPCCWGRKGWKAYLDWEEDILRAIRYVEQNPIKEGKRRQRWSFVSPYCGV